MIRRANGPSWEGVEATLYKNEPGTWMDVSRRVLFSTPDSTFETRFFLIEAGGYSSFERHQHEHCVVVLSGSGRVRLGDEWHDIGTHDLVHVEPNTPHQFRADLEPLGILCIVDRHRDAPELLGNSSADHTSEPL